MRDLLKRHLAAVLGQAAAQPEFALRAASSGDEPSTKVPPEMNPRDYVSYLLTIDAEIEHALMVQYLYAAWSLGGPQVPADKRELVAGWQTKLLGIAKEEMGHLVSVQNVLRLIGAPLYLGREDYPWDTPFYPFPFTLEPATLDALAKYVYVESPKLSQWRGPLQRDVLRRLAANGDEPKRVGVLFKLLIGLVEDPNFLPDSTFQPNSYPFQADFAEWGRGYGGDKVGPPGAGQRPEVLVVPLASRDDAVAALNKIAEQGEATSGETRKADEPPSHFTRFVEIYQGVEQALSEGWTPYRNVAINPYVPFEDASADTDPSADEAPVGVRHAITNTEAQLWAHLFNVRYRLLLQLLLHSFELEGGVSVGGARTPRGAVIHSTFGEMYNLRAIAHVLMETPLDAGGDSEGLLAGPPFLIPYTFDLPPNEANRWRCHRDLLEASATLVHRLLPRTSAARRRYLGALTESDRALLSTIDKVLRERRSFC